MTDADEGLKLIPRKYQEEIFEQARHENVIAALETGSGKTLIAALLVKWVMAQPSLVGKKVIFLVPKVPLVDQQRSFLAEQTPLAVRGYTGSMGVESWDKGRWALEFAQSDCLVMTAQIFKDILVHGYWNMDKVSLLIFDECHHAQKNHPYRMIMADFYSSCQDKPRVFGMTASPIWNPKKPEASLRDLQNNMFAKVIAVREHVESLSHHVNQPVEVIATFPSATEERYSTYYKPTLWETLQTDGLSTMKQLGVESLERRQKHTLESTGPAGADYFLLIHAKKVVEEHASPLAVTVSSLSGSPQKLRSMARRVSINSELPTQMEKLRQVVAAFERRLLFDRRPFPCDWISPKLQVAVEILAKHRSETFQGIVFVSQRQLAVTLSWILSRLPETKEWIRCGELTGHGDSSAGNNEGAKGMGLHAQREVVQSFKDKKLNLCKLITTSVGEEGLDFPACELVIRYDSAQHMVGYVQSRGRARQQQSTFVVLIHENDSSEIARYQAFRQTEPELKAVYQSMNSLASSTDLDLEDDSEVIEDDPLDLAARESYTIPSTGATLTYSSAIQLLNHLCSLIPRDAYTPTLRPKYKGDFVATVKLPRALPIPSDKLTYRGPPKRTKREAKRAVAFMAVRELHRLGVFDDHLSPIVSQKGESIEDADGRPIAKVSDVAVMMDVMVASPWKSGPPWYLHSLCIDGVARTGIVSGGTLLEVDVIVRGKSIQVRHHSSAMAFDLSPSRADLLDRFTKMGIWWCISGSPISSSVASYLVPLSASGAIDWGKIEKAVADEKGSSDWGGVTEKHKDEILVMNARRPGRPLRLLRIRHDISLYDKPQQEDIVDTWPNYIDYFEHLFPVRSKSPEALTLFPPPSGRIFEVLQVPRYRSSSYDLDNFEGQSDHVPQQEPTTSFLLPESFCRWAALGADMVGAFQVFAPVCQRICDVFRARVARRYLRYPPIPDRLMTEALTLPCAMEKFNNQRLETLGDSVLKLSVVVYTFNNFPTKHEGQLTALKMNSVSNRLLLARAKEASLERFLSCEPRNLRTWHFFMPAEEDSGKFVMDGEEIALERRSFPRRSLQDCMEASLGAAYVTGGIEMALQTGNALGLCFGGPRPWPERYSPSEAISPAVIFNKLQEDLQYNFRDGNLLVEAVKHPSFDSSEGGSCYQRLEYLGDAVIELVVTTYLYNKFPEATSGEMTWSRARAICNATLAALAVKRLALQKYILVNNVELSMDIKDEVELLTASSYEDVAVNDWKYDPPKALADIFESVIGAVFVDCGFNYSNVVPIVERIMEDVLLLLHPNMPRDPVTRLLEFVTKAGCTKAKFRRGRSSPNSRRKDSVVVLVHDQIVAGPVVSTNKPLAKGLVAEVAMNALKDDSSEFALHKICTCMAVEDEEEASDLPERNVREKDIDIETTEGFAVAGRVRLEEVKEETECDGVVAVTDEEVEEMERQEVEMLLCTPTSVASELSRMDIS